MLTPTTEARMAQRANLFRREGEYWTIAFSGREFRLKDSKGLRYLGTLIANPGRDIHCLDLVAAAEGSAAPAARATQSAAAQDALQATSGGDAGELLDAEARAAYKRRLADLRADLEEAESFHDPARAERARDEIDALEHQLASAFGLGGRPRRAGSAAERARVNVRNAISAALRAVRKHDPPLAEHLNRSVRTGLVCAYVSEGMQWRTVRQPDPDAGGDPQGRVLATILFTDIVGSTELAAKLGDHAWKDLLDRHDEITRREIQDGRGRVVNSFGDSVFATFAAPAEAIGTAQRIGVALRALGMRVRSAVHTGECEQRGDELGGMAVHICARILGRAEADDVLVSSTVRDLVVGSRLSFDDRGFHDLRGVPGSWRLFAVSETAAAAKRGPRDRFSIMLVDDHPMFRESLRKVIEHSCPATVTAEASDGTEAIEMARAARPDLVVMDMNLPTMNGPAATEGILAEFPETKVLVLSSSDERRDVIEAVRAGATGYLIKTSGATEVAEAIRRVHAGEIVFPPQLAGVVMHEFRRLAAAAARGRRRS